MALQLAALTDLTTAFSLPAVLDGSATSFSDTELLSTQRTLAELRRRVDALVAVLAAETAYRSRAELGYDGLAQRLGARTPQLLVQQVTGATGREANAFVSVGALIDTSSPIGTSVAGGSLSVEAARAIYLGLGESTASVSGDAIESAAIRLIDQSPSVTVERLGALARDARAELELSAVGEKEDMLREKRTFRVWRRADGMVAASGLFAPEDGALLLSAYDAVTAPRRGGPRFVDPRGVDRAERLLADVRATEQLAADGFIELIRLGGAADDRTITGAIRPAVQLIVTDRDLRERRGLARVEGLTEPVSIATAERAICEAGVVPIHFDAHGQVVDVGRTLRLYSHRQRIGLAARDGGCRFPGCSRPPSWCEAHHLVEWNRGGRTDIADGILLCRHHHMLVHNNGWRVSRREGEYFVVPPRSLDPMQVPIPAPSRNSRWIAEAG